MNPIWRVTMEMSKTRSENQKQIKKRQEMQKDKTRREKERRRIEAMERDRQRFIVGQEQMPEELEKDEEFEDVQESAAEKFQKELCWCIQQTRFGLASIKPTSKGSKTQTEEAHKLLRTLTSIKAPMAKKRQVMRATFGDYRSKMHQEERQHKADMSKKKCVEQASPRKVGCGTFLRMSMAASGDASSQLMSTGTDLPEEAGSSGHCSTSSSGHCSRSSSGHNSGSAGHEIGSTGHGPGSPGRDQGKTAHDVGMTGDCPGKTDHELESRGQLGSSGNDWPKNEEDDSSMQELEKSTENVHIVNPVCNDCESKRLNNGDEKRSHEWEQQSWNQNVVNERKNSKQEEDCKETALELSRQAEKSSNPSFNLNTETRTFSFNFDISKNDLDQQQDARPPRGSNNKSIEESQSESSTPEKALGSGRKRQGSRKRNRAKKKQQQQVMMRDKEATVAAGNQKLQLEADGEFNFNFPDTS